MCARKTHGMPSTARSVGIRDRTVAPTEARLALLRPFSLAAIFSAISSAAAGAGTVLRGVAASGPNPDMSNVLMGWSETLVPIYVAFSFLGLAWLLVVVGLRRVESRPS